MCSKVCEGVKCETHVVTEVSECVSIPRQVFSYRTGHCLWIIDSIDAVKEIFIRSVLFFLFPPSLFTHGECVCLHVLTRHGRLRGSTQCTALSWRDLPHLENSHSHHCNRLWHQRKLSATPASWNHFHSRAGEQTIQGLPQGPANRLSEQRRGALIQHLLRPG